MILTKITAVGTDGSRCMLWFDDGSKMRLPTALVADLCLYGGKELSEEELSDMMDVARRASAKDRALRIVSTTAVSKRELTRRLKMRGETEEDAEAAVEWLSGLGAVDDRAMAKRVVETALRKGYGESRIRQELYAKGIPKEYWEEALSDLPDMSEAIDRYLEKKLRGHIDEKEIKRAADGLARRGHNWGDISRALGRYRDKLEDDSFLFDE